MIRRPWSVLAAAGTAAHHGFELRAGVGLVFEPWLRRRGAGRRRGTGPRDRTGGVALRPRRCLARFEPLRRSVRHHFAWAREQARRDPAHWSPALNDRW